MSRIVDCESRATCPSISYVHVIYDIRNMDEPYSVHTLSPEALTSLTHTPHDLSLSLWKQVTFITAFCLTNPMRALPICTVP